MCAYIINLGLTSNGCTEDEYRCQGGSTCIPSEWICDGEIDCSDGADEETCNGNNLALYHINYEFICYTWMYRG